MVNPNYDQGTDDPKWIDKGPSNPDPKFNVDQPAMWQPLTVISAIASGYCERRAVIDPIFITGNTTVVIDGQTTSRHTYTYWGGTKKAVITENCMNNIAAGSPIESLCYSSTDLPYMATIGVAGSTPGNYMTAADEAITALANVYVDERNKAYSEAGGDGFEHLAQSAMLRSTIKGVATSSVELPVINGGTMNQLFYPALPVKWAKQRKWMLDELRYADPYGNIRQAIAKPLTEYTIDGGTFTLTGGTIFNEQTDTHSEIGQTDVAAVVQDDININEATVSTAYKLNTSIVGSLSGDTTANICFYLDVAPLSALESWAPEAYDYNDNSTIYINDIRVAEPEKNYYVLPGGTLIKPDGIVVGTVTVDSGGTIEYTDAPMREPDSYYFVNQAVRCPTNDTMILIAARTDGSSATGGFTSPNAFPSTVVIGNSYEDGDITWTAYSKTLIDSTEHTAVTTLFLLSGSIIKPHIVTTENTSIMRALAIETYYDYHLEILMDGRYTNNWIDYAGADGLKPHTLSGTGDLYVTDGANITLGAETDTDAYEEIYVVDGTVTIPAGCDFDELLIDHGGVAILEGVSIRSNCYIHVTSGGKLIARGATGNVDTDLPDIYVYNGGEFVLESRHGNRGGVYIFGGLHIFDGATIKLSYNLSDASDVVDNYFDRYSAVELIHFDTLGVTGATAGWNYLTITKQSGSNNVIYGTTTDYKTNIESYMRSHYFTGFDGKADTTVVINGTTSYTTAESFVKGEDIDARVYYGTRIAAINKQGGPAATNHYTDFYCRQFYTDSNTHQAT